MNILITGGAGFIGSHLVRWIVNKYPDYRIVNVDKLTYAGNLENLTDVENKANYKFVKADITNLSDISALFNEYSPDAVVHLAAESHVDRSISGPTEFVNTNVNGTVNLLEVCRYFWKDRLQSTLFYHISTDEVFGSLGEKGFFNETTSYDPHSPYSASKAASDHLVRAYHDTYGLKTVISNCSNNYGPYQFPEKLIPLAIHNISKRLPIPVYGNGLNVRDWLFVEDHVRAIDLIFHKGVSGETYLIGGFNEWANIDVIKVLCGIMDAKLGRKNGESADLITYVTDRAGHDLRYAIDSSKLSRKLGWRPGVTFEQGLVLTVNWYLGNGGWLEKVTSGTYQDYYQKAYGSV